jgi:tetratricopeptide (TPR) repeat protein
VLETALKSQPRHTALQVALGRCRLESGDPQGALAVLREVLERDPLQLVANQLLVDSLIAASDAKAAAERLTHYQTLNARDPKIPDWRRRIAALAAAPDGGAAKVAETIAPSVTGPSQDVEDLFDLSPEESPAPGSLEALVEEDPSAETLFPELCDEAFLEPSRQALDAIWRALLSDGDAVEPASPSAPIASPFVAIEEAEPRPAVEPDTEPDSEPFPASRPAATVTLGELYLQQGHVAEAERIFEEVLVQDPGNLAAAEGLRALREALAEPLESPEPEDQDATIGGTWEPTTEEIVTTAPPQEAWASSPTWEAIDMPALPAPAAASAGSGSAVDSQDRLRQRIGLLRRYLKAVDRLRSSRVH